jgi:hypothetical protein
MKQRLVGPLSSLYDSEAHGTEVPSLTKLLASDESRLSCFIINETIYKPASLHLAPQPHKTHRPTHASATIAIPIRIQRPESTHRTRRQEIHPLPQSPRIWHLLLAFTISSLWIVRLSPTFPLFPWSPIQARNWSGMTLLVHSH